jgi:hypothetical protein
MDWPTGRLLGGRNGKSPCEVVCPDSVASVAILMMLAEIIVGYLGFRQRLDI